MFGVAKQEYLFIDRPFLKSSNIFGRITSNRFSHYLEK